MRKVRVKSKVNPNKLAGVIIGGLLEDGIVDVQAMGPLAVNQGMKAIIIATESIPLADEVCCCIPRFEDCIIENEMKTGISILVKRM